MDTLTRRDICLLAVATVAAPRPLFASQSYAIPDTLPELAALVHDSRDLRAIGWAATAGRAGVETLLVRDDASLPWNRRLRQLWNGADVTVVGLTTPAVAFCLDLLARDAGYRLVYQCAPKAIESPEFRRAAQSARGLVDMDALPHALPTDALLAWIIRRRSD